MTWYLEDVSVKTWLKMFPGLKASLRWECPECNHKRKKAVPFIDKDMAGLEIESCPCGQSGSWVLTPRTKELCKKYRDEFFSLWGVLYEQ